ncbi:Magnesium transporter protein 1 [Quillaja saponaria]|uniref:Magnesium transporter protein 1 n=1 Tax=Quillaja saponaria TaxID=32244 RepID=A0AAD7KV89_QUISA|nr:Magnesium transporter protein 1 [Quillaja saponaria]
MKMALCCNLLYLFLFIALCSVLTFNTSADCDSGRVSDLFSLQSRSKSGVIHLDDHGVSRFPTSAKTPRPYWILVFFDAVQLHDKWELRLKDLRNEFALSSFSLFGVNALPHILLIGPNHSPKESDKMDQGDFSRLAESMAEFVQSRTKLIVGPIHRPPLFSRNQLLFFIAVLAIWTPFILRKIRTGQTLLHDPKIWLAGAVFVYFFSVSGAMHNIIRKMPMFLTDQNDPSKLVFFYQGSGMQLGAEGFAVGFLYTIVGLLLAFMTQVLVNVRNVTVQRAIMFSALFVSFWAVKKVVYLDNWKTDYEVHGFRPSSWD